MRIGVRAARALTGLSWSVASANSRFRSLITALHETAHDVPMFSTGLPISLPPMVGPLVGVDGIGRTGAGGVPIFTDALTVIFGFTDSGALT